jgi:heptosyltransferase-2
MRFDLAILFQNAFEAALMAYLGRIKYRVGYSTDGRRFFLSHPVTQGETRPGHQVEYYLDLLRGMGWGAKTQDPLLYVDEKDLGSVQSLLSSKGIGTHDLLVGLSPGAIFGPAKRWPAERFAMIGDWAIERWRGHVVLMGSPGEQAICSAVEKSLHHAALNLCGQTTLGEAMAVISQCDMFVTNDSGLMHVAAALDVPTLAIFGSTDPIATGPRSQRAVIVRRDMDCSPCLRRECPTHHECMLSIEPDDVWNEMNRLKEMIH